ncbi:MAG: hypothetical protein Q4C83_01570 [Candidatus Saccharibacteria bacterium]|nr:hypothetical protein [Candidatus Saccharibacteria bacterium]
MNSSNDAIADANIEHDDDINIRKRQVGALASYITDYLLHGK